MNAKLKKFLKDLPDKRADKIYQYLDGNSTAIEEMKEVIADSHSSLDIVRGEASGGKKDRPKSS
jgi:hypothetical protein